jgi:hypothetical protein
MKDHLFAFVLVNAWFLIVVISWWRNRDGTLSQQSYDHWAKSNWGRWMLRGYDKQRYLREQRVLHLLCGPFFLIFYVVALLGITGYFGP